MTKRRILFAILSLLCILLFIADVVTGSVDISFGDVWASLTGGNVDGRTRTIVIDLRLLKAATALLAGMALSVSGMQMQTLFRNPLAGPYVLGLSSGASLGVALLLLAGFSSAWGIAGAAMAGAAAVMALLLVVNARVRDVMTILVLGIMFSSAIGAIVQILQYLSDEQSLKSYVVWTMGSLGEVTAPQLAIMGAMVAAGLIVTAFTLKGLNLLQLGENQARSLGLNLRNIRPALIGSVTLLAGAVTAFCGPIGFIGIAVPHIARGIFQTADHRILIPASALTGAALLVGCDIVSRQFTLPINAITSLVGIPIVIYILLRKHD